MQSLLPLPFITADTNDAAFLQKPSTLYMYCCLLRSYNIHTMTRSECFYFNMCLDNLNYDSDFYALNFTMPDY